MKRGNKYGAVKVQYAGLTFDSKRECERYKALLWMEKAGEIKDLVADKKLLRYDLIVDGVKVGRYTPDFAYTQNGERIVEDVKSKPTKTRDYVMRKKLMLALHGIQIKEVN